MIITLLILFVVPAIVAFVIYSWLCRYLAARMSEMEPEYQRLVPTALGVILLMGWFAVGISLFPTDLPKASAWTFNILVVGVWALIVWVRHGRG